MAQSYYSILNNVRKLGGFFPELLVSLLDYGSYYLLLWHSNNKLKSWTRTTFHSYKPPRRTDNPLVQ
jgi:hypothetical protein